MPNYALNSTMADHAREAAMIQSLLAFDAIERADGWFAYKGRPTPHPEQQKAPAPKKEAANPAPEAPKPAEPAKESK